jgi:hypothetical protein
MSEHCFQPLYTRVAALPTWHHQRLISCQQVAFTSARLWTLETCVDTSKRVTTFTHPATHTSHTQSTAQTHTVVYHTHTHTHTHAHQRKHTGIDKRMPAHS